MADNSGGVNGQLLQVNQSGHDTGGLGKNNQHDYSKNQWV
jgi:hypothetical protein